MSKKGLLVVSFGTSFSDALERDIVPVETALAEAFPEYSIHRAFGSGMIIQKIEARDHVHIDTVPEALEKLCAMGISDLLIQPTFLIHGIEYDLLMDSVRAVAHRFDSIRVGRPLLSLTEDYLTLADGIAAAFPAEKGTLILMGHGTEHYANAVYPALETVFHKRGYDHIFVGAVEGYPDIDLVCDQIRKLNIHSATLAPLLLVAGDHANNDMASDEPDSWKSRLSEVGVTAHCIIRGLGGYDFVQDMFVNHAQEAEAVR